MEPLEKMALTEMVKDLLEEVKDVTHLRILKAALNSDDPLADMENELSTYLIEVILNEIK
ncbi:MAG: hypothetical protein OEZ01_08365 [Candidatus Heimdallarchaeota archaeon]|nr:hypothetical protein [Candidatus Heimdallarchaeota archaeon]